MSINVYDKERLKKLIECVHLEALREEYQIVIDRLRGNEPLKDDKKYASILKLEIAEKTMANIVVEVELAEREAALTKRIANFKKITGKMKEAEKRDIVEDLKKDVIEYNKDVEEINKKRSDLPKIVKSDFVSKVCKDGDKKWKALQNEVMKKTELLHKYENDIIPAEEGNDFVDVPFMSTGPGFFDNIRNRLESTSSQSQQIAVPKNSLKSNVVYEYKCSYDKSIQYIGFTSRPLVERIKEHLKGKTAVSDHISNCNVCKNEKITVNNFGILKECRNKFETQISEALLIKRYNPILNKQLTKPGITHTLRIFD